jgi:hypothetical protein
MVKKKKTKIEISGKTFLIGDTEKKILLYLSKPYNWFDSYFNITNYSRQTKTKRTTVSDARKRLFEKGLINNNNHVTSLGISILSHFSISDEKTSRDIVKRNQFSTHFTRYTFRIIDDSNFQLKYLDRLHPISINENKLPNYTQYHVKLDGSTITLDKNSVSIRIHDIVSDDMEEGQFIAFTKVLELTEKLHKLGIKGTDLKFSQGHFAKIETDLAKVLEKFDNKYCVTFEDGYKFWIDNSDSHLEQESNEPSKLEKIDNFFQKLTDDSFKTDDLIEIKPFMEESVKQTISQIKQNQTNIDAINKLYAQLDVLISLQKTTVSELGTLTKIVGLQYQKPESSIDKNDLSLATYFG